jgi:hypothetical protein
MKTNLTVATTFAGALLATCLLSGSAQATSVPVLKSDATHGMVTLIGKGRGGGGGGGHGLSRGGGGGGGLSRGGGGGRGLNRGGGGGHYALRSGGGGGSRGLSRGGGSSHINRGSMSRGHYALKDRGSLSRGNYDLKDRGYKNRDAFKDSGKKHYASKDRDHDRHGKFQRHRVFRNGVWVWVYGPAYYAYGDDCYWLRRQAIITGSPYWWDRYNRCIGYDYY